MQAVSRALNISDDIAGDDTAGNDAGDDNAGNVDTLFPG